jgi:hypothetical protein
MVCLYYISYEFSILVVPIIISLASPNENKHKIGWDLGHETSQTASHRNNLGVRSARRDGPLHDHWMLHN